MQSSHYELNIISKTLHIPTLEKISSIDIYVPHETLFTGKNASNVFWTIARRSLYAALTQRQKEIQMSFHPYMYQALESGIYDYIQLFYREDKLKPPDSFETYGTYLDRAAVTTTFTFKPVVGTISINPLSDWLKPTPYEEKWQEYDTHRTIKRDLDRRATKRAKGTEVPMMSVVVHGRRENLNSAMERRFNAFGFAGTSVMPGGVRPLATIDEVKKAIVAAGVGAAAVTKGGKRKRERFVDIRF